jgi:hypothetical protein
MPPEILHAESFGWLAGLIAEGDTRAGAMYQIITGSGSTVPQSGSNVLERRDGSALVGFNGNWGKDYASMHPDRNGVRPVPSATAGQHVLVWRDAGERSYICSFWELCDDGYVCHVSIEYDTQGRLVANRGIDYAGGATLIEQGSEVNVIPSSPSQVPLQMTVVEAVVTISGSLGTIEVRVNGVPKMTLAAKNTRNTGTGITGVVNHIRVANLGNTAVAHWIGTNGVGFLGERRVVWLPLVDIGTYNDGAAAGSESPASPLIALRDFFAMPGSEDPDQGRFDMDGDETYVEIDDSGLPSAISGHVQGLLPDALGVDCVIPEAAVRKDDGGPCTVRLPVISGLTEEDDDVDYTVPTGYSKIGRRLSTDPATNAAWDPAAWTENPDQSPIEVVIRRTA